MSVIKSSEHKIETLTSKKEELNKKLSSFIKNNDKVLIKLEKELKNKESQILEL